MNKAFALVLLLFSGLLVSVGMGCGSSGSDDGATSTGTSSGGSSTGGGGTGGSCILCTGSGGGGGSGSVLVVTPNMASVDVIDGVVQTQQFKAEVDGQDVSSNVTWVFEKPAMGGLDSVGLFTPSGAQGGVGKVTALFQTLEGSAFVTVNVTINQNTAGLTPAEQAEFDNPAGGPDPSLALVYPYDKTVMPLRVLEPEFQWNGGAAADVYRFRLTSQHITYTDYITAPPPSSHTVGQQQWEDIQFSGLGPFTDPLGVQLTRKNGATIYEPKSSEIRIAQDFLHGSVYYWQLPDAGCPTGNNGLILRIKPDSATTDQFYTPGGCWGCHTVSRDGQKMMATLDSGSPFPQITIDLTQDPAVPSTITQGTGLGGTFSAFNDIGDKILLSNDGAGSNERLRIVDAVTGQVLNDNAMGSGCGEPAWSPDGTKLAAICGVASGGGWQFDSSTGHLSVADVAADGVTVSNVAQIVPQAGNPGRPAYPSFSPDSQYIAYGRPTAGSRSTGNGKLWLVGADGSNPKVLENASSDDRSFNPVFAPKSSGGFTWVVFISRRDYGNKMVNMNRQQLWVTAISDPPSEADPSHPPFFLRGQNMNCKSENAYYALDPCKDDGEGCEHGIECCNKSCVYDASLGENVCGQLDPGDCIPTGSGTCTAAVDCCDVGNGVQCINGFCEAPPPK